MALKPEIIKKILYWVAGVWLFFTAGLFDSLVLLGFRLVWIFVICGAVGFADFLFFLYLWHYWGIKKEDVEPINPTSTAVIPGVTDNFPT